jgi:hypothetical protein
MIITLATNKKFLLKKYCFTLVIIHGSKAKVGSKSQRVCSHAQEDVHSTAKVI